MFYINNVDANREVLPLSLYENSMPSLMKSRESIYGIDFSMIIHKITTPDLNIARIWDLESASAVVRYYQNYLWLLRKYSADYPIIPPSIDVDEIWHHHILDTYKYHDDCMAIFGGYLHHYPYFGMRGDDDFQNLQIAFNTTQELHFAEFGEFIPSFNEEIVEIDVNLY